MAYNHEIHKRRSIRLKGYDYSQAGLYFITICVQNRECLFGNIVNGEMYLNDAGKMIEKWYYELMNKFSDIKCGEMIVMPNHFHCIIENVGADLRVCPDEDGKKVQADLRVCPDEDGKKVQADLRVCPDEDGKKVNADLRVCPDEDGKKVQADLRVCPNINEKSSILGDVGADLCVCPDDMGEKSPKLGEKSQILGEHVGSPLRAVVQWFKTMSTNEYIRGVKNLGWQPFDGKLWQRNYYEHIIRNEKSFNTISNYIVCNPAKWQTDKFYQV